MHVHSAGFGEKGAYNFISAHCKKHNILSTHIHTQTQTYEHTHTHMHTESKDKWKVELQAVKEVHL